MADHKCHKEEIISSVTKAISGNGQPGLTVTVARLTEQVSELNKKLDKMNNRAQFNITTAISLAAIVIAAIAILVK